MFIVSLTYFHLECAYNDRHVFQCETEGDSQGVWGVHGHGAHAAAEALPDPSPPTRLLQLSVWLSASHPSSIRKSSRSSRNSSRWTTRRLAWRRTVSANRWTATGRRWWGGGRRWVSCASAHSHRWWSLSSACRPATPTASARSRLCAKCTPSVARAWRQTLWPHCCNARWMLTLSISVCPWRTRWWRWRSVPPTSTTWHTNKRFKRC